MRILAITQPVIGLHNIHFYILKLILLHQQEVNNALNFVYHQPLTAPWSWSINRCATDLYPISLAVLSNKEKQKDKKLEHYITTDMSKQNFK